MPKVNMDFGDVGALPDEDVYRTHCTKAVYKKNKTGDGFIINMSQQLIDMTEDQFENTPLWDNVSFKLSARWRLKEVLEAFTGEIWDDDNMELEVECDLGDDCSLETGDCDGTHTVPVLEDATAKVAVVHDDYNGRLQLRAKNYFVDE